MQRSPEFHAIADRVAAVLFDAPRVTRRRPTPTSGRCRRSSCTSTSRARRRRRRSPSSPRRNGVDLGVDDPADLYRYRDLADFLRVFDLVCRCLRTADDIHRVTYEAMAIAAAAGVRYREVMFSPTFVMRHGVVVRHDLDRASPLGSRDAEADHGIVGRMILDVHKPAGAGAAAELVELAAGVRSRRAGRHRRRRRRGRRRPGRVRPRCSPRPAGAACARRCTSARRARPPTSASGSTSSASSASTTASASSTTRCCWRRVVGRAASRSPCARRPTSPSASSTSVADHPVQRLLDAGVLRHDQLRQRRDVRRRRRRRAGAPCATRSTSTSAAVEALCLAGVDAAWLDDADRRAMRAAFEAELAALR